MKLFSQALVAVMMIGAGSVAKADLACVNGLKVEVRGQVVEIAERMNDAGYLVRDSIIDGERSDSNVFLQGRGSNIVVEVRLAQHQAPIKEGVDHRTEMEYMIELDAATNNVVSVDFSRRQEIDYGSQESVVTAMEFETLQRGSCEAQ